MARLATASVAAPWKASEKPVDDGCGLRAAADPSTAVRGLAISARRDPARVNA